MRPKSGGRWLLIHPPVVRNCEPPPGLARIAGVLSASGIEYRILDLNAEGFDWLIQKAESMATGTTSHSGLGSAVKNRERILSELRSDKGYAERNRYNRAVSDIGLLLKAAVRDRAEQVSPVDYQDPLLSPVKKSDLLTAAKEEQTSLYHPLYSKRIAEFLSGFSFDTVALSIGFLSQALSGFALLGYLRKHCPESRILLGGSLVTSWVRNGLAGDGETFGGLIDALLPGRFEDHTRFLELADNSRLFYPEYSGFPFEKYLAPGPILPVNLSWGCPWKRCTFCPEKSENNPYRPVPAETGVRMAAGLAVSHKPALIHFTDSELSPASLKALAGSPPGAPWYGFARFSSDLADPGFAARLAASGCRMLQLGLESGSQQVLDAMNKGTSVTLNSRILNNLKDAGIGVFLYVLFGTPEETEEEAYQTRDFVAEHASCLTGLNTALFNMPRFGPEAARFEKGSFYEGDFSLYCSFRHPSGWDRDRVRQFIKKEWSSVPAIRDIILKTPAVFTSSHSVFLTEEKS